MMMCVCVCEQHNAILAVSEIRSRFGSSSYWNAGICIICILCILGDTKCYGSLVDVGADLLCGERDPV